ncbi:signal transduction histidine kinase [Zhongshania antarctica]|uniref:histidine kinase n=1 Tax=Zhongshania antarctica TaxID=641702 RepID=A0A840R2V3_9GAMM|nr:ATP-binding protein [Zhongshania antarctica]MBB5186933.1 signal transduction histidine kinase [Zhongshania antarctica]
MPASEHMPILGKRKSITQRILFPLVALIVLSNLVVLSIIMGQLDQQLLDATEQDLINESELQAVQFRANMAELIRDLRFVTGTPPIQGLIRAERNGGADPSDGSSEAEWVARLGLIFSEMLKAKPQNVQIRFIRANGLELIRVDRYGPSGTIQRISQNELQDKSASKYLSETLRLDTGHVYLSDIELNREFGEIVQPLQPVIRAATPVYTADRELFGIVIINHNLQTTFDALKSIAGVDHQFVIANGRGEYLAHPDAERRFAFEYGRSSKITEDFPIAQRLLDEPQLEVLNGKGNTNGKALVYSLRSITYNPEDSTDRLILATSHDFQDALAIKDRMLSKIYLFLIFVLLMSGILAIYVSRRIAGPIISMRNTLNRDGLATQSEDLPIHDGGELGELARAFDNLLQELSRKQTLLAAEITERKGAELELRVNNQKLKAAYKELEQFTYIASHDLQEPLRTVQSLVEMFEENYGSEMDEQAKTFLGFIKESTMRMTALIRGLLDYGRLGGESELTEVDCQELVNAVCVDLSLRLDEVGGSVEYKDLPVITGKKTELRLLFQNLISNGLKFRRPDVSPEIIIAAERGLDCWQFSVSDNGIGIAPEHFQHIFMIFQRLHGRDEFEGSGIGLAHCKKVVELHGGEIWVESQLNVGTVFYFSLRDNRDEHA